VRATGEPLAAPFESDAIEDDADPDALPPPDGERLIVGATEGSAH